MLHITCDLCGKDLRAGEDHHVLKIEVYAALDPAQLTEADLDEDHMEAVSQLLRDAEDGGVELEEPEPASRRLRYDLCPECRAVYLRDPLRKAAVQAVKEPSPKFDFSEN